MRRELRSILFPALASFAAASAVALGCSDGNTPGGENTDVGDASTGKGDARIDVVLPDLDASIDAGYDPGTPCIDDTPLRWDGDGGDGGALPTACPQIASCNAWCTRIATRYKVAVAQAAVACLTRLGTCADPIEARNCVDRALGRACHDDTARTFCSPLVPACDPNAGGAGSNISENDCEGLASALSAAGRTTFGACVSTAIDAGTCPFDVLTCMEDIRE